MPSAAYPTETSTAPQTLEEADPWVTHRRSVLRCWAHPRVPRQLACQLRPVPPTRKQVSTRTENCQAFFSCCGIGLRAVSRFAQPDPRVVCRTLLRYASGCGISSTQMSYKQRFYASQVSRAALSATQHASAVGICRGARRRSVHPTTDASKSLVTSYNHIILSAAAPGTNPICGCFGTCPVATCCVARYRRVNVCWSPSISSTKHAMARKLQLRETGTQVSRQCNTLDPCL